MRVPKLLNPRLHRQILMRFGVYDRVLPADTTPSREVPKHIERPDYVLKKPMLIPSKPEIKDVNQIRGMKRACKLASTILGQVHKHIKVGVTTDDVDEVVHNLIIDAGAYPSPLHFKGFPKSVCTSVNNVAAHGIPDLRPLQDGDILNVDITVYFRGFHGDCSRNFVIGNVDDLGLQLINITEECLDVGIKTCGPGVPFSEIGSNIYRHAKKNRVTVLPAFLGHGIGHYFHGPPSIYHTINKYPGTMEAGMTFTVEPVISHGHKMTIILDDGWTIITEDGARAAQAEHTILITENGAEILTK